MKQTFKKLLVRTVAAKAFAKKTPIIGAIIASEDVFRSLGAAGSDYFSGHKEGAKNELQQAVSHAVGSAANFIGGVSILGLTSGMVAQTMAQKFAESIAAKKPPHPNPKPAFYDSAVNTAKTTVKTAAATAKTAAATAKTAAATAKVVKTAMDASAVVKKGRAPSSKKKPS